MTSPKSLPFGQRRPDFPRGPRISIEHEGQRFPAYLGESVAVALLAAGVRIVSRSIKFHRPRSVFCLRGDCGACLMRIDGEPNVRACQAPVHEGLRCERQNAWPSANLDIFAAADLFFPEGMDHHTLLTGPRPLNLAMQKVVQQLGGLGKLPEPGVATLGKRPGGRRQVAIAVVGGGPAGLAAATAAASELRRVGLHGEVVLLECGEQLGGSYLADPRFGPAAAEQARRQAEQAGVTVATRTSAFGWYGEESLPGVAEPGLLAAAGPEGLVELSAQRYIYATGGHPQNLLFADNDLPGVLAGRAVGLLHTQFGLGVGEKPLIYDGGDPEYAQALATALREGGADPLLVDGTQEALHAARGSSWVTGAVLSDGRGALREVGCDLIAVVTPPAPAFELAALHGAETTFQADTGFLVVADSEGRTRTPRVAVCGEVCGQLGPAAAAAHGHRVGHAAAASLLREGA